jgi:hypothetical protein
MMAIWTLAERGGMPSWWLLPSLDVSFQRCPGNGSWPEGVPHRRVFQRLRGGESSAPNPVSGNAEEWGPGAQNSHRAPPGSCTSGEWSAAGETADRMRESSKACADPVKGELKSPMEKQNVSAKEGAAIAHSAQPYSSECVELNEPRSSASRACRRPHLHRWRVHTHSRCRNPSRPSWLRPSSGPTPHRRLPCGNERWSHCRG